MTQDLLNAIKDLSINDKRILLYTLSAELSDIEQAQGKPTAKERGKELIDVMMAVSGYDVTLKDRRRPIPDCRAIISSQMRREGYSTIEIGRALDVNHSTIIYYTGIVDTIAHYPMTAPDSYKIYKDFHKAIGI
jgi:hypothetical protein